MCVSFVLTHTHTWTHSAVLLAQFFASAHFELSSSPVVWGLKQWGLSLFVLVRSQCNFVPRRRSGATCLHTKRAGGSGGVGGGLINRSPNASDCLDYARGGERPSPFCSAGCCDPLLQPFWKWNHSDNVGQQLCGSKKKKRREKKKQHIHTQREKNAHPGPTIATTATLSNGTAFYPAGSAPKGI